MNSFNPKKTIEKHFEIHNIKPTAVRILVWQTVSQQTETFTLNDAQALMPYMDRSSIFRALKLFAEHQLLHEIDDGTGQKKYCVCRCSDNKHSKHIHFYCYKCEKTYCLENFFVPNIILPSNFIIQDAEFIIKGICNKCINKE